MNLKNKLKKYDKERLVLEKKIDTVLPFYLFIPIVATLSFLAGAPFGLTFFLSILIAIIVAVFHYSRIGEPFKDLSTQVRRELIRNFMKTYHPSVDYEYYRGGMEAKSIIKKASLINPDKYHEEDVITGKYKNANFYFSEIDLKRRTNNSAVTIFKGMLFHLKIPGRNFPNSRIQSKLGLIKRLFNGFIKNEEYGFHYETSDTEKFEEKLGPLMPFIKHLMQQQGDVRIETRNDEILILLKSKVKFLDEPGQSVGKSFDDKVYYENMVQQLNSFLYIVEAFTSKVSTEEIEDKLELKMLQILKHKKGEF